MAQNPDGGNWTRRFAKRPWLWPASTVVFLVVVAGVLVAVAYANYDPGNPDGWQSVLASAVLNGAVISLFGAVITALLAVTSEIRAGAERDRDKRLELFQRMRAAHVRVALMQQILRAQCTVDTYHAQMQDLLQVAKDLEEIREEVKVSGDLYGPDRRRIMEGIAEIIVFLQKGISEYHSWCEATGEEDSQDDPGGDWLRQLVKERISRKSALDPSDEMWEPQGNMPDDYDKGLMRSKLVMRAYVYGSQDQDSDSR